MAYPSLAIFATFVEQCIHSFMNLPTYVFQVNNYTAFYTYPYACIFRQMQFRVFSTRWDVLLRDQDDYKSLTTNVDVFNQVSMVTDASVLALLT